MSIAYGSEEAFDLGPKKIYTYFQKFPKEKLSWLLGTLVTIVTIIYLTQNILLNQPPAADFTFTPSKPKIGSNVTFDASNSYDPDGYITTYMWSFGDGKTGIGPVAYHNYTLINNLTKEFVVILSVTDNMNKIMKKTKNVVVESNKLPVPIFSWNPLKPKVRENISFSAFESRDDDGKIVKYNWTFGDGSISSGTRTEHSYSRAGEFEIRLDVTDDNAESNHIIENITVVELYPAVRTGSGSVDRPMHPTAYLEFYPDHPKVGDKIIFNASKSFDPDGYIRIYEWDFGDGEDGEGKSVEHSYLNEGTFTVRLTVIDDEGKRGTKYKDVILETNDPYLGLAISNILNGSQVAQSTTLIGEYPANLKDDIWVFVIAPNEKYYPQSIDPGNTNWNTPKIDGKWEVRVGFGGPENVGDDFGLVLMVADLEASNNISENLKRWNDSNDYPGWNKTELPLGVKEVQQITIKRSSERWAPAPEISNAVLGGEVSFANIADGSLVNTSMEIYGNCTSDLEGEIWLLVYPTNARWYPQSSDPCNGIHLNKTDETWQGLGTFLGEEFDVVVVLANDNANDFFDEKQREWCENNNDYPGLLTIELPQGIMEKDRVRVKHT